MPERPADMATMWQEAMEKVVEQYKDMRRQVTRETTRPLEGDRMTPAERSAYNQRLLSDDVTLAGEFEEMAARFQLPAGSVPRRLWEAVKRAAREEPDGTEA